MAARRQSAAIEALAGCWQVLAACWHRGKGMVIVTSKVLIPEILPDKSRTRVPPQPLINCK